jgi:hypothetical protein
MTTSREAFEAYYTGRYDGDINCEFAANMLHSWETATTARDAHWHEKLQSEEVIEVALSGWGSIPRHKDPTGRERMKATLLFASKEIEK